MFSSLQRPKIKQILNKYTFDLLVIGGGITGAGIALDAVTRGLSVALIDMQDFAAGTSSRSTKLVHGGLRYLKQLDVKVVAETGREREIVYQNARHITEPMQMLLPIYKDGTFGKRSTSIGLYVYDLLAKVHKNERREMLTAEEALEKEPFLKSEGLQGAGCYVEYQTDDARLTIETLKKAAERGVICLNYVKAEQFQYEQGKITGVYATDILTGDRLNIQAAKIVNATGPWVDELREQDDLLDNKKIIHTKGIHIVIDQVHFPLRQGLYFDAPDGRMIFAIPRGEKVYVGTTDTFYDGDKLEPKANEEEIAYLIDCVQCAFSTIQLKRWHIESTWAGIRPLISAEGKEPSEISRKDEIWVSDTGLITIAGGKLTGYRKMAETVVDKVVHYLDKKPFIPAVTEQLRLSGGEFNDAEHFHSFLRSKMHEATLYGLTLAEGNYLASFYGTNVDQLLVFANVLKNVENPLPLLMRVEVLYAIHYEMAITPSDYLIRRKGSLYFEIDKVEQYKLALVNYMAELLSYTELEKSTFLDELEGQIQFAKGGHSPYERMVT
ncbi:glycerol-3-phosphate dehydrogenase/oxidase [Sporosarcina pasteurii]|uniref:Glycerol-3-phosphate dehydrogenase n=1 Tax=Sporosarcina pasteurii TaxID=1474 RepID=A0A380BJH9_SPOPA|nr:glycerol-3-phosphate dehydrogenase/oxidase [Sporosarcina pasteurii]MDS9470659.1 glycerol-3-phosphate dehydrogenase/oxidase [Sporosarcina pasteurii]QBQ05655.1 glycerol-3-phosphate dehydrogenase/oxidase [Sporosarcina pasteurii]SUJ01413.1 Aerobic glycerol-3-phosphate dehydrogenase [Sporosarcina pasteurii]